MATTVAVVAGIVAAWFAAGSTGLLAASLCHALTWGALAVALFAVWRRRRRTGLERGVMAAALGLGIALTIPAAPVCNVLAVAAVLSALAWENAGMDRRALGLAALAVTVLGVYRLACTSISAVWLLADTAGHALGHFASFLTGKPLEIGATFGGLDFLVLMAALYGGWLSATARPRIARVAWGAAAILAGHLVYLLLLSYSHDLAAALPDPPPPVQDPYQDYYVPPPWSWSEALRTLLPWNLPLVAALIQGLLAGAMFRWAAWRAEEPRRGGGEDRDGLRTLRPLPIWLELGPAALAILVPLVACLSLGSGDLSGRKIVAYERGRLNWDKPAVDRFGRDAAGLYGMLPTLVKSLGGEFVRSTELSANDLDGADVLLLIHPTDRWVEHADRFERIWDFVRSGGSLLVVAEPRTAEDGPSASFNELLSPTGIEVRFDTALAETGYWQHSLEPLAHPATVGLDDAHNSAGLVETSSIRTRWPACPLLVGRWGWSDPGSDAVLTGVRRFDPGERLGDLVLGAEQQVGAGRVVVLGDASGLTNEMSGNSYQFLGRLLGGLASRNSGPQVLWRQALGLLACLALIGLLVWRPAPARVGTVVVLAGSLLLTSEVSLTSAKVLPDGRSKAGNFLACIDAAHLGAYSGDEMHDDGLAGLRLTLMRNGYLPIMVPQLTEEQLQRAGLLISVAPSRAFSAQESQAIQGFVERGGVFLMMVGAERAGPGTPLLEKFGLKVPPVSVDADAPGSQPLPMGFMRTLYGDTADSKTGVTLRAAWPVETSSRSDHLVFGFEDRPIVAAVRVGQGRVVVIGDSAFATNRNVEAPRDATTEQFRENAAFWQWLLGRVTSAGQKEGTP